MASVKCLGATIPFQSHTHFNSTTQDFSWLVPLTLHIRLPIWYHYRIRTERFSRMLGTEISRIFPGKCHSGTQTSRFLKVGTPPYPHFLKQAFKNPFPALSSPEQTKVCLIQCESEYQIDPHLKITKV